jgi:hypothetical protein
MKIITFMKVIVEQEKFGFEVTGNDEVIVVRGKKGKIVIPFKDIYNWRTGELRKQIIALKHFDKDGDRNEHCRQSDTDIDRKTERSGP